MKITRSLLSIPPYISTAWSNIASLHLKKESGGLHLIVSLNNGAEISIPDLAQNEVDAIFEAHAKFSETENSSVKDGLDNSFSFSLPLKPEGSMLDSLGAGMQHNPAQSNLPPLPPEVLEKIATIVTAFGLDDTSLPNKPEPDCNCVYCQISRALLQEPEEEVAETDLAFRDWEITQKEEKLYHLINPLDKNEYYDVFLGDPLGCTCGSRNCEHIRAVLNT